MKDGPEGGHRSLPGFRRRRGVGRQGKQLFLRHTIGQKLTADGAADRLQTMERRQRRKTAADRAVADKVQCRVPRSAASQNMGRTTRPTVRTRARRAWTFEGQTPPRAVKIMIVHTTHRRFARGQPAIEQSIAHPVQLDHIGGEILQNSLEPERVEVAWHQAVVQIVVNIARALQLPRSPAMD